MAERHGFHEAHFTSLPYQSNVYGLTTLAHPGGVNKVLVAPLKDKVVSLEYLTERRKSEHAAERSRFTLEVQPVAKEIPFAGIPDDAEITSIDTYRRLAEDGGGYVIGITFTKDAEKENPTHFLNIYAPWEKGSEYVLESIAQTLTNIELDFTPFYLSHTKIEEDGLQEMMFLLTGSDKQIHLYREEVGGRFSEHPVSSIFPEFNDLPCVALWLDTKALPGSRRVSAVGCRSGYIRLVLVNTNNNEVITQWEAQHDSAITCSRLFTSNTGMESADLWLRSRREGIDDDFGVHGDEEEEEVEDVQEEDVALLVTSAMEVAVVYRNILKVGFKLQMVLPQSDLFDCALCTCVADLDWDGFNELLIGTYGQVLLVYKYVWPDTNEAAAPSPRSQTTDPGLSDDTVLEEEEPKPSEPDPKGAGAGSGAGGGPGAGAGGGGNGEEEAEKGGGGGGGGGEDEDKKAGLGHYELLWSRSFAHPVLALSHFDLTGDGLQEIIVLSTRGLHILQHNLEKAAERCLEALKEIS